MKTFPTIWQNFEAIQILTSNDANQLYVAQIPCMRLYLHISLQNKNIYFIQVRCIHSTHAYIVLMDANYARYLLSKSITLKESFASIFLQLQSIPILPLGHQGMYQAQELYHCYPAEKHPSLQLNKNSFICGSKWTKLAWNSQKTLKIVQKFEMSRRKLEIAPENLKWMGKV